MAIHRILSLNYITSGTNRSFVNVDIACDCGQSQTNQTSVDRGKVFIMDIDLAKQYSDPDQSINNIVDIAHSSDIIFPMYDIIDVHIKSAEKRKKSNLYQFDAGITQKREDVYLPQLVENPIECCQIYSNTYVLTEATKYSPEMLRSSLYDMRQTTDLTQRYTVKLHSDVVKTYLYRKNKDGVIDIQGDPVCMNGVMYNYITEFPQNDIRVGYYQGNEYGYIFRGKNAVDSQYNMQISVDGDYVYAGGCRDYAGIGKYGDQLYFKYYDDVKYSGISADGQIQVQPDERKAVSYQKIENFHVNRFSTANAHKTGFFSVKLLNSELSHYDNMDESVMTEKDKRTKELYDQVMKDITGAIREISENMQPAYTQLFNVMFD